MGGGEGGGGVRLEGGTKLQESREGTGLALAMTLKSVFRILETYVDL